MVCALYLDKAIIWKYIYKEVFKRHQNKSLWNTQISTYGMNEEEQERSEFSSELSNSSDKGSRQIHRKKGIIWGFNFVENLFQIAYKSDKIRYQIKSARCPLPPVPSLLSWEGGGGASLPYLLPSQLLRQKLGVSGECQEGRKPGTLSWSVWLRASWRGKDSLSYLGCRNRFLEKFGMVEEGIWGA